MAFDPPILIVSLVALAAVGCAAPRSSAPHRPSSERSLSTATLEPVAVASLPAAAPATALAAPTPLRTAPFAAAIPAPELTGSAWLNSPPLHMADLRGKVVIIDFWTFGCFNCVNTFPAVRALYDRYKGTDVVLISVHTPEFDREKNVDSVRDAAKRFEIEYPIVVDNDMAIFRAYENRFWPALYIVDRQGFIRDQHAGELHIGMQSWNRWLARIEALRAEPPSPSTTAVSADPVNAPPLTITPAARSDSPGTRSPDPTAP